MIDSSEASFTVPIRSYLSMFLIAGRTLAGLGILVFAVAVLCAQSATAPLLGNPLFENQELTAQQSTQMQGQLQTASLPPTQQVSAQYRIGNGDVLQISVWGEAELTRTVTVRPDGRISLPLINEVEIAGLTSSAAQSMLDQRFARYIRNPQSTVIVSEVRSNMVYISGRVFHPGAYPLAGSLSVVQLIARAGGLADHAKSKHIYVLRESNHSRLDVNYKAILENRRHSEDVQLLPGDTVVVP